MLSSVTTKGQVTIPAEIRRLLGVRPHDKVAFRVKNNQVQLTRSGSVIERTAGALRRNQPALSAKQLRERAEEAIAQETIKRTEG